MENQHPTTKVELLRLRILATLGLESLEEKVVEVSSQKPRPLRLIRRLDPGFEPLHSKLLESTAEPQAHETLVETWRKPPGHVRVTASGLLPNG